MHSLAERDASLFPGYARVVGHQAGAAGKSLPLIGIALLAGLVLTACGDREQAPKSASQLAAKVNSTEISIHQLNFALQNLPDVAAEPIDEARRHTLEELVDQELAVQQALAAKLDRTPEVLQSLEAARREILAHAWLAETTSGLSKPTSEEIAAYYSQHPELFANRKIYHLQEADFPATATLVAQARDQIARGHNAAELLSWFKSRRTPVSGGTVVKPAEKIELDMLPRLAAMQDGETALFQLDSRVSVVTLLGSISEPLAEDDAKPLIDDFLRRQRGEEMAKTARKKLRAEARIEYLGEFSKEAEQARKIKAGETERERREAAEARAAASQAQAAAAAQEEEARRARADADTAQPRREALPPPADNVVTKGVAGLR